MECGGAGLEGAKPIKPTSLRGQDRQLVDPDWAVVYARSGAT